MASSPDFVEYVCFQLRHAGEISFKKMFGEYGLYCDRKYFGLVCDNQLFVKVTVPGLEVRTMSRAVPILEPNHIS